MVVVESNAAIPRVDDGLLVVFEHAFAGSTNVATELMAEARHAADTSSSTMVSKRP